MENVSRFLMTNSSVSLPLKLTGRHMEEVSIQDSTFTTLPWPGIFLHNASQVRIVRNFFLQTVPRSISISLGNLINVSHNLLDVSEALKIEQYEHQVMIIHLFPKELITCIKGKFFIGFLLFDTLCSI